ncbi:hypothetical protein CLHUN_36150 [Ruminiclostridium hungatei]|uniref:UPF0102 protein CLHUN_36150 n=1 Tax=Ruminiclostridium hungatei TaxID=48256 RepID=A0A1V4SF46_RUMHU|nr:YraN family protein [Ruminiclostridium hungatei]OPX42490.1 hypothetical protein CLHUN_36150 [Ruminiclostridium hungatei]
MSGMYTVRLGAAGEEKAAEYLLHNHYAILNRNFRISRLGEIDIIARDAEYICFIEVKTRRSKTYGTPGEAVIASKQNRIRKIAAIYLGRNHAFNMCVRFDVIEIIFSGTNGSNYVINSINHIKNAY